tara:strand:- start:165 stop:857 length:693 start_codon:yes stop_codon:yes gene_type:complete
MITSIMQPTFFPWPGYFNLISSVENFVFLDDAQFSKGSWHNRNKIFLLDKIHWLTLPIEKQKLHTPLNKTVIKNKDTFKTNIKSKIINAYKDCPHYNCVKEILTFLDKINDNILSEVNISIIKFICKKLNLNEVNFFKSSQMNIEGKRTQKVIKILDKIGATSYLSAEGAQNYLAEDDYNSHTKIPLSFLKYSQTEYYQKMTKEFVSNLSIIDVIANTGWINTEHYVKSK